MNQPFPAYLIDASIAIFRFYFSLPARWTSRDGYGTAAVYGYTHWLRRLLLAERPVFIAACFDESIGSGFRHQLDARYKSRRAKPDDALAYQLRACREVSELLGVPTFSSTRYEADDLIGTLAGFHRRAGRANVLVSRDKDLAQLLGPGDQLWHYPDGVPLDPERFAARFGFLPAQLPDYLALVGDPVDDIPGVPGVGPKSARTLLQHLGSLDEILQHPRAVADLPLRGAARLAEVIAAHESQLRLCRQLTAVCCDAPLEAPVRLHRGRVNWDRLLDYTQHLGFRLSFDPDLNPLGSSL